MAFAILFVCTGNTCRSPMAEVLARRILGEGFRVESAGVSAMEGAKASAHARSVVGERGGSLEDHRSRRVEEQLLREHDLVVAMTTEHRERVRRLAPALGPRIVTLGELAGRPEADVRDPYGGSVEEYEDTYDEIERLLHSARPELERRRRARSARDGV